MRGEMAPLLEDGFFYYEETLASHSWGGGTEITPSKNRRKSSGDTLVTMGSWGEILVG